MVTKMKIKEVRSNKAPKPAGPYSQSVRIGKFLFCSGQIGIDPNSGKLVGGGIKSETKRAMENIAAILSAAGIGLGGIARMDVFLTDMDDYNGFNAVYSKYFANGVKPARQTIEVSGLPKNAKVEISCIAFSG